MSVPMRPDDPAYWMLLDDYTSSTTVYDPNCYICRDPEFAQMGMPLCRECSNCREKSGGKELGHVPADDDGCTVCGYSDYEAWLEEQAAKEGGK